MSTEPWEQQPGAVAFVANVRKIDDKLADAILIALRGGYTLSQVQDVCRAGNAIALGPSVYPPGA